MTQTPLRHLEDDDFVREVQRRYGGIPEEIMNEPDLLALLLPSVRADVHALETYRPSGDARISCPVTVLGGTEDPNVPVSDLHAWNLETAGPFEVVPLPGGHFFFNDDPDRFFDVVTSRLNGKQGNVIG
jgi:surfactin synthase thioesterase subunit